MTLTYSGTSTREAKLGGKEFVAIFSRSQNAGDVRGAFGKAAPPPTLTGEKATGIITWNAEQITANLARYEADKPALEAGLRAIAKKVEEAQRPREEAPRHHAVSSM